MQAPVISDTGQAFFLDFEDVVYIDSESAKRYIYLHTASSSYQLVRTVMDLAAATSDSLFQRVEQNTIVNFKQITDYDPKQNILYFLKSGEKEINSCYVSRDNRSKVIKYLKSIRKY
ncbi:DNA-binding LytR/AlgR family response regulator [Paenibacillus sp. V4I3]|uniref:LytTR family DNA-binding domain-containing protein n=1 Tax=Paenibacillus sp. V4I3 TaxID=3042305 RepID=UPI00278A603E|nr:LytTR family transcriptional regulator DNA-binding domain-containing protein [Paenibacillus sp. V4I3]MDQ0873748.1 DNA-binding LytR/AlgR family response regulator [Paenibacillus sp. V4I3]